MKAGLDSSTIIPPFVSTQAFNSPVDRAIFLAKKRRECGSGSTLKSAAYRQTKGHNVITSPGRRKEVDEGGEVEKEVGGVATRERGEVQLT
jgi:hypothetical protein